MANEDPEFTEMSKEDVMKLPEQTRILLASALIARHAIELTDEFGFSVTVSIQLLAKAIASLAESFGAGPPQNIDDIVRNLVEGKGRKE